MGKPYFISWRDEIFFNFQWKSPLGSGICFIHSRLFQFAAFVFCWIEKFCWYTIFWWLSNYHHEGFWTVCTMFQLKLMFSKSLLLMLNLFLHKGLFQFFIKYLSQKTKEIQFSKKSICNFSAYTFLKKQKTFISS